MNWSNVEVWFQVFEMCLDFSKNIIPRESLLYTSLRRHVSWSSKNIWSIWSGVWSKINIL